MPTVLAEKKSEPGGSLTWREAGQTAVSSKTLPGDPSCLDFRKAPEGTEGEAGREALWLAIQILGLAAWSFRVVEQDGDMWLRARRPGHVTPGGAHVCYHGTSFGVAQKILRADAILPGPNQGASGRAEPVAFMAKSFKLVEQYTGPSKITGTQRLCAVVFGGEAIGDSWKSNNGNYRVATGWLPTTVWLRIWGAGKASDLKRTWAYGGNAFAWPGKQLAPAPGRAFHSPTRPRAAEAAPRAAEPAPGPISKRRRLDKEAYEKQFRPGSIDERTVVPTPPQEPPPPSLIWREEAQVVEEGKPPRGRRSGREVDDEFLAAAKAVEAGTFEGGMWRAWKELRTREKRRERGQNEPGQPAAEPVAWKRRSHGDKGRGLAKARGWSCGCGMNNHIARGSCRKCSAARPGSAPIPTREEYDEYEKHTSKKKGGKKRKWENKGWKTCRAEGRRT